MIAYPCFQTEEKLMVVSAIKADLRILETLEWNSSLTTFSQKSGRCTLLQSGGFFVAIPAMRFRKVIVSSFLKALYTDQRK